MPSVNCGTYTIMLDNYLFSWSISMSKIVTLILRGKLRTKNHTSLTGTWLITPLVQNTHIFMDLWPVIYAYCGDLTTNHTDIVL